MQRNTETDTLSRVRLVICEKDLGAFEFSRFPVWVFDIERAQVIWANDRALDLWEAESRAELIGRKMGKDMSTTVRTRLLQYQLEFPSGAYFDESWTLYPKGKPKTVICRFRGCKMLSGQMAMLCEAEILKEESPAVLRGAQALLYTGAMVTIYNAEGACIFANPAALKAFSSDGTQLDDRILDPTVLTELRAGLTEGTEGHYVSDVLTRVGVRIHEIEARKSYDAINGAQTLLLTEIDISEKEEAKRKVEHLANHDFLTGLHNRHYLTTQATPLIADAFANNQGVFLVLLDLDRFKFVNDTLGHSVGDEMLRKVAENLTRLFPKEAIIGRLGGDEFCILYRSQDAAAANSRKARRLVQELKQPLKIGNHELHVDISVGISHIRSGRACKGFDDLLARADLALYAAKQNGGGTVRHYNERLYRKRQRFWEIEGELRHALMTSGDQLSLHYQPIVSLSSHSIVGIEALARFRTCAGESIPPSEFIPIAEATGLIGDLGHWVLETALQSRAYFPDDMKAAKLSVNVSPLQFHSSALLAQLRSFANRPGFNPAHIEIELTESALHIEERPFAKMLQDIVRMGYSLAIDDFGSAYSNVARLAHYPINTLKIDRSMTLNDNRRLTTGIINIGQALNLKVVAEGVETTDQRDWLISEGCMEHQGFLYSKPLSLDALSQLRTTHMHHLLDAAAL